MSYTLKNKTHNLFSLSKAEWRYLLDLNENAAFIRGPSTHHKNIVCLEIQGKQIQIINKVPAFLFLPGKFIFTKSILACLIKGHSEFTITGKLSIKVFLERHPNMHNLRHCQWCI